MHFTQVSLRGSPLYVRPEHVAAIRPARQGEAGESILVLASGVELVSPFDPAQLCARLTQNEPPPFDEPAPDSEQRALIDGLYRRLDMV
ncbi:MAG: hypothetical protein AB7J28_16725 [Hyphomonadaceae bacterium]